MTAGGGPWGAERHGLARQTAEGTRAAGPARHGDGEGVRTDRQGRELGGHLPGAELGPLGRTVSSALREQETPVARLRRLDPPRGSHTRLPQPPTGFRGPCPLLSPHPHPDPNMAQPPFVPTGPHPRCFLVWTGPPQALFLCLPGREVSSATPHPTPAHFLCSGLGVRSWRPQDDSPLTPSCPFIC